MNAKERKRKQREKLKEDKAAYEEHKEKESLRSKQRRQTKKTFLKTNPGAFSANKKYEGEKKRRYRHK